MKIKSLALIAVLIVLAGCEDDKPYTPPKGGASMGAASTGDLTKAGAKDDGSEKKKDEKSLDVGSGQQPAPEGEAPSAIPDLPSNNPPPAPDVEFDNSKNSKGTPKENPKPPTAAPSTIQWTPSNEKPAELAASADSAMLGLKNTLANIPIMASFGDVKGWIQCRLKLRNEKTYWAQYAQVERDGLPHAVFEVSNGAKKTRVNASDDKSQNKNPTQPVEIPSMANIPEAWMTDMPKIVLSPWISDRPIFATLVKGFQSAGFETKVETLSLVKPEHTFRQDRLTFSRSASQAAKLGPAATSIVFDRDRHLPVTIEIQTQPKGHKPVKMLWRAEWHFNKTFSNQTFSSIQGS